MKAVHALCVGGLCRSSADVTAWFETPAAGIWYIPSTLMGLELNTILRTVTATLIYASLGMVLFAFAFWLIAKSVPFSLRKEIEVDQNVSLGIVIGSVFIGIAMILSAAIRG